MTNLRNGIALLAAGLLGLSSSLSYSLSPRTVAPRGPLLEQERTMIALFDAAAPSVAYITTERVEANLFFAPEVSQGAGSGFVWDAAGHIVTNAHVIQGARRVLVQLDAASKPIPARIVGFAPDYDLAVLRLNDVPSGLRAIPLGTSKDLKIGQSVIAIGNPFGLNRTLTTGIVSALERQLPTTDFREVSGVIQTDAAINPGNSGGPLLDSAGRLIGVNTAIRSASGSSAGVGFAIPVDLVNRIVPQLIATGRAPRAGIGIAPVDPFAVARAGIKGVVLRNVAPGGPAAQAGLRAYDPRTGNLGDVIVEVNDRPIDSLGSFVAELDRVGIGNTAELTVKRDDKERKVKVRVVDVLRE
jgi:2-alkenal reductase